jgi:hypothetical protein
VACLLLKVLFRLARQEKVRPDNNVLDGFALATRPPLTRS